MRRVIGILGTITLVVGFTGTLCFLNKERIFRKLLSHPVHQEIALPEAFWKYARIEFFWELPRYNSFTESMELVSGRTVKDTIQLNLYTLVYRRYTVHERIAQLRETWWHEVGHMLYNRAVSVEALELKRRFSEALTNQFKTPRAEYFEKMRYASPARLFNHEEAFADSVRIMLCSQCNQITETAIELTPEVKSMVHHLTQVAFKQK